MIRDLRTEQPAKPTIADICIVGAGAAGIALAVELAGRGRSVTLLEAGGRLIEPETQEHLISETAARPHRGLLEGRARALGGTTHLWGGQILELDTIDFETRPWICGSGWPFAKSELTPYYRRALELEGVSGSLLEDDQVWRGLALSRPEFNSLSTYLSRWCPEPNFATLHRAALEGADISVWLHANATGLELQDGEVRGVRCHSSPGSSIVFRAKTFVFCLGAIESSRFFLQPRADGGTLPWNESGLLGRHFQDHIDCTAATVVPLQSRPFHQAFDAIFLRNFKYNPKLKLDAETVRAERVLQAGATFFSAGSNASLPKIKQTVRHLLRGQIRNVPTGDMLALVRQSPSLLRHAYRFSVEHRAYHSPGETMKMRVHCEQEPAGQSRILLADTRDEFGLLRTRLEWHISALELTTIRTFTRVAQQALASLARIIPAPALGGSDEAAATLCEDSFHHMGGMRMHPSAQCGVVDTDLRLHGTRNAHVLSSAVFPTSGFSNPTHTLLALGMRLAEHLTRSPA